MNFVSRDWFGMLTKFDFLFAGANTSRWYPMAQLSVCFASSRKTRQPPSSFQFFVFFAPCLAPNTADMFQSAGLVGAIFAYTSRIDLMWDLLSASHPLSCCFCTFGVALKVHPNTAQIKLFEPFLPFETPARRQVHTHYTNHNVSW